MNYCQHWNFINAIGVKKTSYHLIECVAEEKGVKNDNDWNGVVVVMRSRFQEANCICEKKSF